MSRPGEAKAIGWRAPERVAASMVLWLGLAVAQGCSRAPTRPVDYMGPWAVGYRRVTAVDEGRGRTLPLAIWYPAEPGTEGERASYLVYRHPLVTVRVPSPSAIWDAPVSRAHKWPLIIFSHGAPAYETQCPTYVETLASQGYVVVAVRHVGTTISDPPGSATILMSARRPAAAGDGDGGDAPPWREAGPVEIVAAARRGEPWAHELVSTALFSNVCRPFDVWSAIDWIAAQGGEPASFLHGAVDAATVGVTGHSGGGTTCFGAAIGYGGKPPDPRVKALVAIAPAGTAIASKAELRTIVAPALFIVGDRDERAPWDRDTLWAFEGIGAPTAAIVKIRGVGHTHFADIEGVAHSIRRVGFQKWAWGGLGGRRLQRAYSEIHAPGMLPAHEAQRIQIRYALAFFDLHLKGDRRREALLTRAGAAALEPGVELIAPAAPGSRPSR